MTQESYINFMNIGNLELLKKWTVIHIDNKSKNMNNKDNILEYIITNYYIHPKILYYLFNIYL